MKNYRNKTAGGKSAATQEMAASNLLFILPAFFTGGVGLLLPNGLNKDEEVIAP